MDDYAKRLRQLGDRDTRDRIGDDAVRIAASAPRWQRNSRRFRYSSNPNDLVSSRAQHFLKNSLNKCPAFGFQQFLTNQLYEGFEIHYPSRNPNENLWSPARRAFSDEGIEIKYLYFMAVNSTTENKYIPCDCFPNIENGYKTAFIIDFDFGGSKSILSPWFITDVDFWTSEGDDWCEPVVGHNVVMNRFAADQVFLSKVTEPLLKWRE
ncbi:MAG: hypothetical protein FWD33_00725 [Alphaproteobacteria bacterium]|nr:hypothetical protein [Alphaproteobacteria bacterium]